MTTEQPDIARLRVKASITEDISEKALYSRLLDRLTQSEAEIARLKGESAIAQAEGWRAAHNYLTGLDAYRNDSLLTEIIDDLAEEEPSGYLAVKWREQKSWEALIRAELSRTQAAEAKVVKAVEAADNMAHDDRCEIWMHRDCDCGLDNLLSTLKNDSPTNRDPS